MRRESDRRNGERTGLGRRVRDRILAGDTAPSPRLREHRFLENRILFLADDLRESALAVGGIEAFLVRAQRLLEDPELTAEQLRILLDDHEVLSRIDLLADALASLRRSIGAIHDSLNQPAAAAR